MNDSIWSHLSDPNYLSNMEYMSELYPTTAEENGRDIMKMKEQKNRDALEGVIKSGKRASLIAKIFDSRKKLLEEIA